MLLFRQDRLLRLEMTRIHRAMKMETPVKAPQDGTVATVDVAKGESVDSGKVLVTLN